MVTQTKPDIVLAEQIDLTAACLSEQVVINLSVLSELFCVCVWNSFWLYFLF